MRKNIRNIISSLLALAIILSVAVYMPTASAMTAALGNVTSAEINRNELLLTVENGTAQADMLSIKVCQDNILCVDYRPNSVPESPDTPMIDPNLTWSDVQAEIDISGNPLTITTADMCIEISKTPCRMKVKKSDGTVLFWESESGGIFHDGVRFVRAEESNIYGIHGFDCFSDNGNLLRNNSTAAAGAGQQGNSGGPFFWSTAGYGILVDADGGYPYTNSTDRKMEFYYGDTIPEGRRYTKEDVECYIILGTPKEIMAGYSKITGTSPMMPKWSLGFSNFEWNINEAELKETVEYYRAKNIPIDSYAIDYDWKEYGRDNYGEFAWNTTNFPSAADTSLKTTLENQGIKLIGITKPRIVTKLENGTVTEQGKHAETNDFFYPGHHEYTDYFLPVTVRSIDFYNPATRAWWWEHSADAFDKGIVGWWNDETDKVSSNGAESWFGNFETMGISQAMYEGQRAYTKDGVRVWQTARNYYPGTQRYGTSIWSGDVATQFCKGERVSWAAGLNEQKAALLSTINNGQPKWGSDGGGFNQNSGNVENPSPELYTRWLQLSSVTPVFRVHGTNYHQRQPWCFGTTAEEVTKAAIQQRYSWLPYLYSYERSAYDTGLGLVRPLLFDYPTDQNVADYSDAWMLGEWLLVAPVTERGQSCKWIYLPEGNWFDYNRGTQYTGGRYIPYNLNSTSWTDLPIFVKAGAIIPTQDVLDYVDQKRIDHVYVDVFPATEKTSFTYYDDDGQTYGYEMNKYYQQTITAEKNGNTTNIAMTAAEGNYNPGLEYFYIKVHGQAATTVFDASTNLNKYPDYNTLVQSTGEGWTVGRDIYGEVTYLKVLAGSQKSLTIEGNSAVQDSGISYEAEDASLSGSTTALKAAKNNNHAGYSGSGFVDKFESDEAAITFYAKVANAGEYDIHVRYSNGDLGPKTLSVYVNGTYEGQLVMPGTGNWDSWGDVMQQLHLAAGNNIITLKYDVDANDTGYVNIDYISVPYSPSVILAEAEEAALYGATKKNQDHWLYTGSGFVDTLASSGDGVEFPVVVDEDGMYDISLRYANGTQTTKTLNLYVNDRYVSTMNLPSDGGNWNSWQEYQDSVSLVKGMNSISLKCEAGNSGNVNIDRLAVNLAGTATVPIIDNGDFERSEAYSSAWTEWHPDGQTCAYGIDSGSGTNPPESPAEGDKRAYFYSANAYQQSIHQIVTAEPASYSLDFWVKCFNTQPTVARAEIKNGDGTTTYVDLQNTDSWKHYSVDGLRLEGDVDIGFYVNSPGGTTLQIDGVKLKKMVH